MNEENKKNEQELEFNKKNREYTEKLMDEAGTNNDGYWDSNSVVVRLILLGLLVIIIIGSVWVFGSYFS